MGSICFSFCAIKWGLFVVSSAISVRDGPPALKSADGGYMPRNVAIWFRYREVIFIGFIYQERGLFDLPSVETDWGKFGVAISALKQWRPMFAQLHFGDFGYEFFAIFATQSLASVKVRGGVIAKFPAWGILPRSSFYFAFSSRVSVNFRCPRAKCLFLEFPVAR